MSIESDNTVDHTVDGYINNYSGNADVSQKSHRSQKGLTSEEPLEQAVSLAYT